MQPEVKKFLSDALEGAQAIEEFARGKRLTDMEKDNLLRSAIYYRFVIIGEALTQMRRIDEETFERISEVHRIVGFRNQIIHGYQVMRNNVTWRIIQDKLPIPRTQLEQLLAE
jgi:uncharacterized protein with HEPN domain